MIKYFCDACGETISKDNEFNSFSFKLGGQSFILKRTEEVISTEDAICKYCIIDTITKFDNRPRISKGG